MDQNLSLVLDLGRSYLRIGYSGDDAPRVVSETYLGVTSETQTEIPEWDGVGPQPTAQIIDRYLSGDSLNDFNPSYTYEPLWKNNSSSTPNPRMADFFSKEILSNRLSLDSKNFPVLMAEDNNPTKDERKALLQVFLDSGITNNFMLMRQSLLSVYACGKINGAVIDSSSYTTSISTIEEGYFVQEGYAKLNFGGEHVTQKIVEKLAKDSNNILPDKVRLEVHDLSTLDISYIDLHRRILARKIKHALFSESSTLRLI